MFAQYFPPRGEKQKIKNMAWYTLDSDQSGQAVQLSPDVRVCTGRLLGAKNGL